MATDRSGSQVTINQVNWNDYGITFKQGGYTFRIRAFGLDEVQLALGHWFFKGGHYGGSVNQDGYQRCPFCRAVGDLPIDPKDWKWGQDKYGRFVCPKCGLRNLPGLNESFEGGVRSHEDCARAKRDVEIEAKYLAEEPALGKGES